MKKVMKGSGSWKIVLSNVDGVYGQVVGKQLRGGGRRLMRGVVESEENN